jgi:hypothetical protein
VKGVTPLGGGEETFSRAVRTEIEEDAVTTSEGVMSSAVTSSGGYGKSAADLGALATQRTWVMGRVDSKSDATAQLATASSRNWRS